MAADSEKATRKLLVTGDYTYMLTLPKEWVRRLGWRAKQLLQLRLEEGRVIVQDHEDERREP